MAGQPARQREAADLPTIDIPIAEGQHAQRTVNSDSSVPPKPPYVPPATFFDGSYADTVESEDGTIKISSYKPRGPLMLGWRFIYNLTMVLLDMIMMLVSCVVVLMIRPDIQTSVNAELNGAGRWAIPAFFCATWILALWAAQSYHRHTMGEGYGLYTKVLNAAVIFFVALCAIGYIFSIEFPRTLVVIAAILGGMLTMVERWMMRLALHRNRRKGEFNYRTVIVGSPKAIHEAIDTLGKDPGRAMGYSPIAVCPIASVRMESDPDAPQHLVPAEFIPQNSEEDSLPVLRLDSHLPQRARKIGAHALLVTDVMTRDSETLRTLSLGVESLGIELAVAASVADIAGGRMKLRNNSAMPILTASLPQYSWRTKLLKRVMDIVLSVFALVVTSPILIAVAIAVKTGDGGPVFYMQERIGQYGRPFKVYKFRSMRVNADKMDKELAAKAGVDHGILFKPKDDPRITKVGKFIRKTSLDEFPQFLNVLKGDMSIVGPRPQQQYEVDEYGTLYSARLLVKPGITGPWQISGRSDLSQEAAEYLDVSYVENWSITTDLAIMVKTVGVIFNGSGAY